MKLDVEVPAPILEQIKAHAPKGKEPLSYEQQQQRELNALPPALRKQRVKQLRLMRRFAKGSCYHPSQTECERAFGTFRKGST